MKFLKSGIKEKVMKRQIRRGVFESNSSSTHSLVICSEEEFDAWKNGELLFDCWQEEFVKGYELSKKEKEDAEEEYEYTKNEYQKDWNDLSDEAKEKYYKKYADSHDIFDGGDLKTYSEYMNDDYLESYRRHFTSKNGDKIVCFGRYGYDG
jgi:hypothetical protein